MHSACKTLVGLFEVPSGAITCLDSSGQTLFLGTDGGRVCRYRVEPNEASASSAIHEDWEEEDPSYSRYLTYVELDQQLEPTAKRRIGQVLLDNAFNRLFVLCEGIVSVHDPGTLRRLGVLDDARGAHSIALNAPTYPAPSPTHCICAAVKKRILVFSYGPDPEGAVSLLTEPLMMPQMAATLGWLDPTRVVAGFPKEYSLLNVVTGEAAHLAELTAPAPLVAQLDREVILRLGPNAMLIPADARAGEPSRQILQWDSEPAAFGLKHPFIVGVEKRGLAMYSMYTKEIVQRLSVPQGALFCSTCRSRGDALFLATAKKVYLLTLVSVDHQIQSLVQRMQVAQALALLERNPAPTERAQEERRGRLNVIAGARYLEKGRLEDAFGYFMAADLMDCRDLFVAFLPHLLAPSLAPHAPVFRLDASSKRMSVGSKEAPEPPHPPAAVPEASHCISDNFISLDLARASASASPPAPQTPSGPQFSFSQNPTGWPHVRPESQLSGSSAPGTPLASALEGPLRPTAPELDALAIQALCLTPEANRHVIAYLLRRKAAQKAAEFQAIDYALLWLYLKEQMHQEVDRLLRHPNACHVPDCAPLLEEREEFQYLAMLYMSKQRYPEAAVHLQRKFERIVVSRRARLLTPVNPPPKSPVTPQATLATLQGDVHPIFSATESTDLEYLRSVLEEYGPDVLRHRDSAGNTPLHYAVALVQSRPYMEKVVSVLVDSGADIHAANGAGISPLTMADTREAGLLRAVADFRRFFLGDASAPPAPPPPPKVKTPYLRALQDLDAHGTRSS